MLGSAGPASATTQTSTSSVSSTSPARPSRLRGLSYLRGYTREHLHPSSSISTPSQTESPHLTSPTSSPIHGLRTTRSRANSDISIASPGQDSESGGRARALESSALISVSRQSTSTSSECTNPELPAQRPKMTRSRTANPLGPTPIAATTIAPNEPTEPGVQAIRDEADAAAPNRSEQEVTQSVTTAKDALPTIRFIPHIETRSSRPSLQFTALSRTLKNPNNIVRVGRYSERDAISHDENVIPVGFKSKVVSRRHCEFWCTKGQWYVKDVKSSSGTFLNHVRLSSPGAESRPFPINDGDVIQLGIDFKGGEEIIFRCVKIRIECNRDWQKSLNNFNTSAHQQILRNVRNKVRDSDAGSVNNSECSICLNPVSPCQALFVAPCGHLWHYKCIRNLIHGPNYPNFLCPNCRLVADLDADVEPPEGDLLDEADLIAEASEEQATTNPSDPGVLQDQLSEANADDRDQRALPQTNGIIADEELANLMDETSIDIASSSADAPVLEQPGRADEEISHGTKPVAIIAPSSSQRKNQDFAGARSATPTTHADFALAAGAVPAELMTPRNDAGPFVLDGDSERFSRLQVFSQRTWNEEGSSSSS